MRPYTRPNRRPRPSVERAHHQIERVAHVRTCSRCHHPVLSHAIEDGVRVCSRGEGVRISCADCAETWARMPAVTAMANLARVLSTPPRVASLEPASLVLSGVDVCR
ncbi:hypothetical protein [Actinacidiphila sp. bgisy160]|uniref:hypothetical protein n=1 Tax=Actinacidiphila sp. bgisy160 TaxID=3413796 RepID=UPI003D71324A